MDTDKRSAVHPPALTPDVTNTRPKLIGLLFDQAQRLQQRNEATIVRPPDDEWMELTEHAERVRERMRELHTQFNAIQRKAQQLFEKLVCRQWSVRPHGDVVFTVRPRRTIELDAEQLETAAIDTDTESRNFVALVDVSR